MESITDEELEKGREKRYIEEEESFTYEPPYYYIIPKHRKRKKKYCPFSCISIVLFFFRILLIDDVVSLSLSLVGLRYQVIGRYWTQVNGMPSYHIISYPIPIPIPSFPVPIPFPPKDKTPDLSSIAQREREREVSDSDSILARVVRVREKREKGFVWTSTSITPCVFHRPSTSTSSFSDKDIIHSYSRI